MGELIKIQIIVVIRSQLFRKIKYEFLDIADTVFERLN